MIIEDIEYWDNEKNYEDNIISVFGMKNILTDYLDSIKNQSKKEIIDFGCGTGNAFSYLKRFMKVYAVDFSDNMLSQAKQHAVNIKCNNIKFKKGNLQSTTIKPVDVILASSSVMPKNLEEFDAIIINFIKNLKKNGEIIIILPSFESRTLQFHYKADFMFRKGESISNVNSMLVDDAVQCNFSPLGYFLTDINLIQKHWLKDEIKYRLGKFKFDTINIQKLPLDWKKQIIGMNEYEKYPKLWFWMVNIYL